MEESIAGTPSFDQRDFTWTQKSQGAYGLLDTIIGIQQGETTSFPLEFPQSWKQESLRGVTINYICKELFYRDLPPIDDTIAGQLLPGCTTLEQCSRVTILMEMGGGSWYGDIALGALCAVYNP